MDAKAIAHTLEFGRNEIKGYTVTIEQDTDAESPREWDNLGTMVCWHPRYDLGDEQISRHTAQEYYDATLVPIEKAGGIVLPLYLYDHSGLRMNVHGFHCPWDSGQVGFIYVTAERIRKEYSVQRISAQTRAKARSVLIAEVETYDQYLSGDVYGYTIDKDDEHVDSCWGFFGADYAKEQAAEALLTEMDTAKRARYARLKEWIRNRVPLEYRAAHMNS